jgi:murein DD-endopeptidase MepM/ murein hydrolase activator NlpD
MDASTQKTIRTFAAGAGCGFLAGALLVGGVLWQQRGDSPSAMSRWVSGLDDAGDGVITASRPDATVATSGTVSGVATPAASPEAVISAPPAADLGERDLLVPVEGVEPDQLVRSFTEARGGRQHEALDILAPRNTPVRAVEGGRIARLFYSKAGGITIYQFDPTGQFCYYYAHLDSYAAELTEGQTVQRGQTIGYVGTTGNAPAGTPHLHFAIFKLTPDKRWWDGVALDPYLVLR